MSTKCTATKRDGTPCKAWAMPNSSPPRCGAHKTTPPHPGAPIGNTNAQRHGAYAPAPSHSATLDGIISDLATRINGLGSYIDANDLTDAQYLEALNLLSLLATRLARIMRDQRTLTGQARSDLQQAITDALDVVSTTLGTAL